MAEADAQDWNFSCEVANRIATDTSFLRVARPWRDAEQMGLKRCDFFERGFIIFNNANCGAELSKILNEVIGERIVIIDEEKIHRGGILTQRAQRKIENTEDF